MGLESYFSLLQIHGAHIIILLFISFLFGNELILEKYLSFIRICYEN